MPEKIEKGYKKYLVYIKDLVYIVGLVIAIGGWLTTKSKNEAILETTVKYNTETIQKLEVFMQEQAELNGKIIQFMITNNK
jgi:hypothetical protein